MLGNKEKVLSLTGKDILKKNKSELVSLFHEALKTKMHGICFSPYEEGQFPGTKLTDKQIRRRIEKIAPHSKWIRTFSCTDGNELIPEIAHEYDLKTLVGAWLGKDTKINNLEIENLIKIADEGHADILAVGNEVMYRKDLTEKELIDYLREVKNRTSGIPVGYVDAYYEFENSPKITETCDIILANCYPFWEGCHLDYSLLYMKDMYRRAKKVANGKKVIITETGWPSQGANFYGAEPSEINALKYFLNAMQWSAEENIEMFYFSSFDESWKIKDEGDVGAFWGLWDFNEQLKF